MPADWVREAGWYPGTRLDWQRLAVFAFNQSISPRRLPSLKSAAQDVEPSRKATGNDGQAAKDHNPMI